MSTVELIKLWEGMPPADRDLVMAASLKLLKLSDTELEALREEFQKQLESKP